MTLDARQQAIELDDLMARSTFGNILKAAKSAQRVLSRNESKSPALIVLTEAGQTVVYDSNAAAALADTFAQLGFTAVIVQLISVATRAPKQEPPQESGEPPDGRTG